MGYNNSNTIPVDTKPEKIRILLNKLRLHMLTKDEARELMPLLEEELQAAKKRHNETYEQVIIGLINILQMYLADTVNLYESNIIV